MVRKFLFVLFFTWKLVFASEDFCRPISERALDYANRELELTEKILDEYGDYDKFIKKITAELDDISSIGNSKFMKGDNWAFDVQNVSSSGIVNKGLYKGEFLGKKWFIKGLGKAEQDVILEFQNAQKIHALGLGPEVHLVKKGENYFMVMEEVGGVNIKDIVFKANSNPQLIEQINNILKTNYKTLQEARTGYAKAILADKKLMEQMKQMAKRLYDQKYFDPNDFQFMLSPTVNGTKGNLDIIDVGWFKKIENFEKETERINQSKMVKNLEADPIKNVEKLIRKLEQTAMGL